MRYPDDPDRYEDAPGPEQRSGPSHEELVRRGPGVLLGMLLLTLGAFVALFGYVYGPIARGGDMSGNVTVDSNQVPLALVAAVIAVALGGAAAFLFRGSVPMVALSVVVMLAGVANFVQLLPYV